MEQPLLVFVSSVISGMEAERQAVRAAIQAIPLTRSWLFEESPASSLPLDESYLSKVRECDIFVLLLGDHVTDPVKLEVQTATDEKKPRLVFLQKGAPDEVVKYAQSLGVKYATYENPDDLAREVAEAVGDAIIRGWRDRYRIPGADLGGVGDFLQRLAAGEVHINIGGGDVILNLNTGERPPEELLRAYYDGLAGRCSRLPLGVIDDRFLSPGGEQPSLHSVYVDLDVVAPAEQERADHFDSPRARRKWAIQLARGEGRDRTPVLKVISDKKSVRVVLLGDAGSGKTTFVDYLAYLLASDPSRLPETLRGLLPVRLVLREVIAKHVPPDARKGTAQMIWDALADDIASCLGQQGAERLLPHLQERLLQEGGVFLFDGLDEVPAARERRRVLLEAVQDFAGQFRKTPARFLVTARPYAYADPQWHLPGFVTLSLAPFDEGQVRRFVERWYEAVRPATRWSEETARIRGSDLLAALLDENRPYLGDLASRPLLLTLIATTDCSGGHLPEDRADLYEQNVQLLLGRWQRARDVRDPDGSPQVEPGIAEALGVGEDRIRDALQRLAHAVHDRQGKGPDRDDAPADISKAELLDAFEPLLGKTTRENLLRLLQDRAGLLVAQDEDVYAFPHRSFQEYLAACNLAALPGVGKRLKELAVADPDWWREVCLLGIGKARQGGLGQAAGIVGVLISESPDELGKRRQITDREWRLAALAGQALVELRLKEYASGDDGYESLLWRARRWLVRLVEEGRLNARERADAGRLLGQLGDPRDGVGLDKDGLPDILWSDPIPAGPFQMGNSKESDPEAYDDEGPRHTETIEELYRISRYPITNTQYDAFVRDGGYTARWQHCWTAAGWEWKGTRAAPDKVGGAFDLPNHPVVVITWYEAVAFCNWLSEKTGQKIELPSEAQWERAARSTDARRYPWNGDITPDHANYGGNVGTTTAVGIFPLGVAECGALDMSGNVWEWCLTKWRKDYSTPADDRPEGDGACVLRGGAFDGDAGYVRCAVRSRHYPGSRHLHLGFRVVASPIIHDSGV